VLFLTASNADRCAQRPSVKPGLTAPPPHSAVILRLERFTSTSCALGLRLAGPLVADTGQWLEHHHWRLPRSGFGARVCLAHGRNHRHRLDIPRPVADGGAAKLPASMPPPPQANVRQALEPACGKILSRSDLVVASYHSASPSEPSASAPI